ncbi:MAG: alpha-ketoacid dehydrogenase subunit beta [Halieaceae bacterium]|jgi:pyruvate dehydrogenase E1 component beta subunit|nr:alpha-ketoacid dehydrogenase subunit beta [Halieaceae bacterium]
MAELNMVEAINLALREALQEDDSVLVFGEDVGVDGGVFRVTDGLIEEFGEDRVFDTPLAESLIVGTAVGMAAYGLKPVCELQFSGFSYEAFHQIESHAARLRWRSQGRYPMPLVIRMPYGGGGRALEHHSESREVYFAHTPGLKTVIPSSPRSARAMLAGAIRDPDPVIFMEPKRLYRAFREEVPEEPECIPPGTAAVLRPGEDATLVSYGAMMQPTLEAAGVLEAECDIHCEVIDLRSLSPLDTDCIAASSAKTGHIAIVHEAPKTYGPGAEVVATINERSFYYLKKPVRRIAGFDVIIPLFAREKAYLPDSERIVHEVLAMLEIEKKEG